MLSSLRSPRAAIRRHFSTRTRGQSLVEFALILPVFMLFFAAVLDLGRIASAQIAVSNAAREGVFQAAVTPADFDSTKPCPADGKSNVVYCRIKLESSGGVSVAPTDVTVACNPTDCSTGIGHTVTVRVTGHFRLLTPLMAVFFGGNQNVTFSGSATAARETLPVTATGSQSSAGTTIGVPVNLLTAPSTKAGSQCHIARTAGFMMTDPSKPHMRAWRSPRQAITFQI